ncbi:MAG: hypothetical protein MUE51_00385 [Thermoleophilia bacterium]|jgi:hypothetical protein|nr:hypothetical protein [Thermoleophilia bacterium]
MADGPVTGGDVRAALAAFGPPGADVAALDAAVPPEAEFASLDDLARACPPGRIGLRPGAFAALFGPLFGEFE